MSSFYDFTPVQGKSSHGRGPIQLSWNYNYGMFSKQVLGNKDSLLNKPELLVLDYATRSQTFLSQSDVW
ncbi:MAG: hypothetical protein RI983_1097 [Bacteroidota bacterium]|jgi:hypothetical protein